MFEIKVTGNTLNELRVDIAKLHSMLFVSEAPPIQGEAQAQTQAEMAKPKRGRPPKVEPEATQQAPAPVVEVKPAAPVSTESLFGGSAPAPVVEAPKPTQKDLIAAFRALAETKGTSPILDLLAKHGGKSVAAIPEAAWPAAIADAKALTK